MSLLAYYLTLPDTRLCAYFNGNSSLQLSRNWTYTGAVTVEWESWVNQADFNKSFILQYGGDGSNRFILSAPYLDSLYFDYGNTTTGRLGLTMAPFAGGWVNWRAESGGAANTTMKLYANGVLVAEKTGSAAPTGTLTGCTIGAYVNVNGNAWKGWMRNLKVWQGATLFLDMPLQNNFIDLASGQTASLSGSVVFTNK